MLQEEMERFSPRRVRTAVLESVSSGRSRLELHDSFALRAGVRGGGRGWRWGWETEGRGWRRSLGLRGGWVGGGGLSGSGGRGGGGGAEGWLQVGVEEVGEAGPWRDGAWQRLETLLEPHTPRRDRVGRGGVGGGVTTGDAS